MITRDNYEEFFLLYLDSELSASERQIVEKFVAENPDLREEWEGLQQCRVSPDKHLVFGDKGSLFRKEGAITDDNYEGYFLSFIDGELSDEDRKAVADYTNQDTSRLRELMLLQDTISTPDPSIVFEHKELLYRKEGSRKILALPWIRIAAAASIILAIGLLLFNMGRHHLSNTDQPSLAAASGPGKARPAGARLGSGSVSRKYDTGFVTTQTVRTFNNKTRGRKGDPEKRDLIRKDDKVQQDPGVGQEAPEIAQGDIRKEGLAHVGKAADVANVRGREDDNMLSPNRIIISPDRGAISRQNSSFASQALLSNANSDSEDDIAMAGPATPKKNKLRGIFRRVSRVFEKTADVDDDKRGILIGNFQVALK